MNNIEFVKLIANLIVNLILAYAVFREAELIKTRGRRLSFLAAFSWSFITLITGVFGAFLFWFINSKEFRISSK